MKPLRFIFLFVSVLLGIIVFSQDGWTLKKDNEGIKVYIRKTDSFKLNEIKVETIMTCRLSQLAATISDVAQHEQWVYKAVTTKLLKQNSPTDLYYYTEIDAPWPFENRDVVMHMTLQQMPQSKVLYIYTNSIDNFFPVQKDIVRIAYSRGRWSITPLGNNQVKIEYQIQVDTGDGLPAWLINLFATNTPYETFLKLRDQIKLPRYAQAKLPFIAD